MFQTTVPMSPVEQKYIWMGEYLNGAPSIFEYEENGKSNSFYDIEKDKLIRFGLIGGGSKRYFEVYGGTFKIDGVAYDVVLKTRESEYTLTGLNVRYDDIIQFKESESIFMFDQPTVNRITSFNIGYKNKLSYHDLDLNIKIIAKFTHKNEKILQIRIVSSKDIEGALEIRRNGKLFEEFPVFMSENLGGEINWRIR